MGIKASEAHTRRLAVWSLLLDGRWHATMEVNAAAVGGSEGCRRLRELRREVEAGKREGYSTIRSRKKKDDSTQYEYRLIKGTPTGPTPSKQSLLEARVAQLEAENERLRTLLASARALIRRYKAS